MVEHKKPSKTLPSRDAFLAELQRHARQSAQKARSYASYVEAFQEADALTTQVCKAELRTNAAGLVSQFRRDVLESGHKELRQQALQLIRQLLEQKDVMGAVAEQEQGQLLGILTEVLANGNMEKMDWRICLWALSTNRLNAGLIRANLVRVLEAVAPSLRAPASSVHCTYYAVQTIAKVVKQCGTEMVAQAALWLPLLLRLLLATPANFTTEVMEPGNMAKLKNYERLRECALECLRDTCLDVVVPLPEELFTQLKKECLGGDVCSGESHAFCGGKDGLLAHLKAMAEAAVPGTEAIGSEEEAAARVALAGSAVAACPIFIRLLGSCFVKSVTEVAQPVLTVLALMFQQSQSSLMSLPLGCLKTWEVLIETFKQGGSLTSGPIGYKRIPLLMKPIVFALLQEDTQLTVKEAALDTWMFLLRATAAAQVSPWEDDAAALVRSVVEQVVGLVAGDPAHQRRQERYLQRPHLYLLPKMLRLLSGVEAVELGVMVLEVCTGVLLEQLLPRLKNPTLFDPDSWGTRLQEASAEELQLWGKQLADGLPGLVKLFAAVCRLAEEGCTKDDKVWASLLVCWQGLVQLAARDPQTALGSLLQGLHDCLSSGPLVRSQPVASGQANGHAEVDGNIGKEADSVERGGGKTVDIESPRVQLLLDALHEVLQSIERTALLQTGTKPPWTSGESRAKLSPAVVLSLLCMALCWSLEGQESCDRAHRQLTSFLSLLSASTFPMDDMRPVRLYLQELADSLSWPLDTEQPGFQEGPHVPPLNGTAGHRAVLDLWASVARNVHKYLAKWNLGKATPAAVNDTLLSVQALLQLPLDVLAAAAGKEKERAFLVREVGKWREAWQLLHKWLTQRGSQRQAKVALKHGNIADHIAYLAGTIQEMPVDTAWMRFCTEAVVMLYGEPAPLRRGDSLSGAAVTIAAPSIPKSLLKSTSDQKPASLESRHSMQALLAATGTLFRFLAGHPLTEEVKICSMLLLEAMCRPLDWKLAEDQQMQAPELLLALNALQPWLRAETSTQWERGTESLVGCWCQLLGAMSRHADDLSRVLQEIQDVEISFLEPLAAGLGHRHPKIASATLQFWLRSKVQAAVESLTPPESYKDAFLEAQAAEVLRAPKPVSTVLAASIAGSVQSHPKDAAVAADAVQMAGEAGQQNGSKEKGNSDLKRRHSRLEESQTEYVKIPTATKKHRPLTEHQKEVAALQRLGAAREGVLTYTRLDASQDPLSLQHRASASQGSRSLEIPNDPVPQQPLHTSEANGASGMEVDWEVGASGKSSEQEEDDEEVEMPAVSQACFADIGLSLVSHALSQGSPPGNATIRKGPSPAAVLPTSVPNGPAAATVAPPQVQGQPSSALAAKLGVVFVGASTPPAVMQPPTVTASSARMTEQGNLQSHSASTPMLLSIQGQSYPAPSSSATPISTMLTWAAARQPMSTPAHIRPASSPLPHQQAVAATPVPGIGAQTSLQGPASSRPASLHTYRPQNVNGRIVNLPMPNGIPQQSARSPGSTQGTRHAAISAMNGRPPAEAILEQFQAQAISRIRPSLPTPSQPAMQPSLTTSPQGKTPMQQPAGQAPTRAGTSATLSWGPTQQQAQTGRMPQFSSPQRSVHLALSSSGNTLVLQQAGNQQQQQLLQGATSQGFPPTFPPSLPSPSAQQLGRSQQAGPQPALNSLAGTAGRSPLAAGPTAEPAVRAPGVSASQALLQGSGQRASAANVSPERQGLMQAAPSNGTMTHAEWLLMLHEQAARGHTLTQNDLDVLRNFLALAGGKPVKQPSVLEVAQKFNPQLALELKLLLRDLAVMEKEGRRRVEAERAPLGRVTFPRQWLNREQLRQRQDRTGLNNKAGVMTAIEAILIEAHHPQPLKEQLIHILSYWATLHGILHGVQPSSITTSGAAQGTQDRPILLEDDSEPQVFSMPPGSSTPAVALPASWRPTGPVLAPQAQAATQISARSPVQIFGETPLLSSQARAQPPSMQSPGLLGPSSAVTQPTKARSDARQSEQAAEQPASTHAVATRMDVVTLEPEAAVRHQGFLSQGVAGAVHAPTSTPSSREAAAEVGLHTATEAASQGREEGKPESGLSKSQNGVQQRRTAQDALGNVNVAAGSTGERKGGGSNEEDNIDELANFYAIAQTADDTQAGLHSLKGTGPYAGSHAAISPSSFRSWRTAVRKATPAEDSQLQESNDGQAVCHTGLQASKSPTDRSEAAAVPAGLASPDAAVAPAVAAAKGPSDSEVQELEIGNTQATQQAAQVNAAAASRGASCVVPGGTGPGRLEAGALVSKAAIPPGPGDASAQDAKEDSGNLQLAVSAAPGTALAHPPGRQLHAALQHMTESLAGLDWSHVEMSELVRAHQIAVNLLSSIGSAMQDDSRSG